MMSCGRFARVAETISIFIFIFMSIHVPVPFQASTLFFSVFIRFNTLTGKWLCISHLGAKGVRSQVWIFLDPERLQLIKHLERKRIFRAVSALAESAKIQLLFYRTLILLQAHSQKIAACLRLQNWSSFKIRLLRYMRMYALFLL